MPESPEVQALVDFLGEKATGRRIRDVDLIEFRAAKTRDALPSTIVGRRVTGATRHGKHVDLQLDGGDLGGGHLVISLGRHGWVRWRDAAEPSGSAESADTAEADLDAPPALAEFVFDDDSAMAVTDAGSWVSVGLWVVDDPAAVPAIAKLGPDPANPDFSRADFDAALGRRKKQIKAILQEQESIAGIGNAYSDEILHLARVSPVAHAADLGDDERDRLFQATVETVRAAIAARGGIPIARLKEAKVAAMRVHGRTGEACPVCGDTIRDHTFSGASAQYCPTCQTGGVPLS